MRRYFATIIVIALSCSTVTRCQAQVGTAQQTAEGIVRLELLVNGSMKSLGDTGQLTIRLHNEGPVPLSLPQPTRLCGDSINGSVMVHARALHPISGSRGTGCVVDRIGRTDVLSDAKKYRRQRTRQDYVSVVEALAKNRT